jgi:type I thyroxine 5'-deiodinase
MLDGIENAAGTAFAAWPERIFILDRTGRIAYRGGRGPYDVRPEEARGALEHLPTPEHRSR